MFLDPFHPVLPTDHYSLTTRDRLHVHGRPCATVVEQHPIQLAHHASLRVNQLCTKARGLDLRVNPNKTEVFYVPSPPPPRGTGATRGRTDPTTISTQVERTSFLPGKSIKWLGVSLELKLSPAIQAAARAAATASVVRLVKRLSITRLRGFPPSADSKIIDAVVTPSLLYGMVQLDTGPTRAAVNGRLVPLDLRRCARPSPRSRMRRPEVISQVWLTVPTTWLWWLAGLYPEYLLDKEQARWRARAEVLPANHFLWIRLARSPFRD